MKIKQNIKDYKNENGELNIDLIVNKYFSYIYKIIINSSINYLSDEDIEEIIYDVFLVVWKNSEKLDEEKKLEPYMAEVTRRLILKKARNKHIELDIEEQENTLISEKGTDDIVISKERNNKLYEQILLLKENDREIFVKYYYNGLKIKEIAKQMSMNDFTVKTRLHRIRKKLEKILESEG